MEVCSRDLDADDLDGGTFDNRFTIAGVAGFDGLAPMVYDFAIDTDGSIVAAGEFQYLGSQRVEPLLRYKNGAWGPARATWEIEPPGSGFSAVAINAQGHLALATYYDFGPYDTRPGQIWIDDGSGLRVIGEFQGVVRRMVWYQDKLWVGGYMTVDAATDIDGLAVWNGTAWSAAPGGALMRTGGERPAAYELRLDGANLLVGGAFTRVGGVNTQNAASYDGTAWSSLSFPNAAIYALLRDNGTLYAAGTFGDQFGAAGGIARRNGTAWELLSGGLQNQGIVGVGTDLVAHAGSIYVAGCFHTAGGAEGETGAVVSLGVARYDGAWHSLDDGTQSALGTWFQTRRCGDEGDGYVFDVNNQRLLSAGNRLLLGGNFPGVAGVQSQALIANDGTSWVAQGAANLGMGGNLEYIAASGTCEVYGYSEKEMLSHIGGQRSTSRLHRFTGTAWDTIDDDAIAADALCLTGVKVSRAGVAVVGCVTFPKKGDPVGTIYKVSGKALVEAATNLPFVHTLAFDDDENLWIGASGPTGGGILARWDGTTTTIIEDGFDGPVTVIDPVSATDVIVAGTFTRVGELAANNIARLTGTAWAALGAGAPGMPLALAHDATSVYVSTYDDGSTGGYLLGKYDGTTWTELATASANLTRNTDFSFYALRVVGDAIVAGGTAFLDDDSGRGVLVYRNGRFTSLGGGVNASTIKDVAITSDAIWVAGSIAEAGSGAGLTSTVGLARYEIAR